MASPRARTGRIHAVLRGGRGTAATKAPIASVPVRQSLLVRLLAVSALVSVCSISATAWVVLHTTAVVLSEERGQALADDAGIYDSLLGYAAAHRTWDRVGSTVGRLGGQAGHRIVLTSKDGRVLADSAPEPGHPFRPPQKATAVVDPLSVDTNLSRTANVGALATPGTAAAGPEAIDPRAVGPFRLSAADSRQLHAAASRVTSCLHSLLGIETHVQVLPSGRPRIVTSNADEAGLIPERSCEADALDQPLPSEKKPLAALNVLVDACLERRHTARVYLSIGGGWIPSTRSAPPAETVTSCLSTSRAQQLAPYVAPAALLYVSGPDRTATTFFDLSAANRLRIAGWSAAVVVVTVTVTALAGVRMVRPLRVLTAAALRMEDGELSARVPVRGGDEIARLSAAFNAMSERREQLEAVRRDMTNDIAHELRTPVSNLRGWLEAVEDGIALPDTDLVASLHGQALQLQHIIEDLRDLSAAEAGELRLAMAPVRVEDLLSDIVLANQATARGAGVTLELTADPAIVVTADPVRLRQMVDNLVSNAVRHTPAGGRVALGAWDHEGEDRAGDIVVVTVADTGSGIAADQLPHVFDRFWRAEKSRNRQSGGSGLGLAIVRRLAEAHGGTVTVTSTPGTGSTFALRLPKQGKTEGAVR